MSVRENLVAAGQLYGMVRRDIDARIKALLEGLKLRDRLDEKVEALSGGLARRVELAKALLPEPQVLILDEPTTGLDPISRQEFWSEVGNLRGEGTTVSCHDPYPRRGRRMRSRSDHARGGSAGVRPQKCCNSLSVGRY